MKFVFLLLLTCFLLKAEPLLSTWYTKDSGRYARVFQNDDSIPNNATTTWYHPAGGVSQITPTYAGVHELSYTDDWLYLRTTGLASYSMGPWYADATRTTFFPSFPENRAILYRIPRTPVDPTTVTTHTLTAHQLAQLRVGRRDGVGALRCQLDLAGVRAGDDKIHSKFDRI